MAAAAAALLLVAAGVALIGTLELLLSELLTCAAFKVEKNSSCKSSNINHCTDTFINERPINKLLFIYILFESNNIGQFING